MSEKLRYEWERNPLESPHGPFDSRDDAAADAMESIESGETALIYCVFGRGAVREYQGYVKRQGHLRGYVRT